MATISFTLDLPDRYFNIIASKYSFPPQLTQLDMQRPIVDDITFCKDWLIRQIVTKILEPEYLAVKQEEIHKLEM